MPEPRRRWARYFQSIMEVDPGTFKPIRIIAVVKGKGREANENANLISAAPDLLAAARAALDHIMDDLPWDDRPKVIGELDDAIWKATGRKEGKHKNMPDGRERKK